jgi:citrate lyase gamma subunit
MSLVKKLREQGYDYIDGPIRNHNLFQIWRKLPLDEAEKLYGHISHAFNGTGQLNISVATAMEVNSTVKQEYGLKVGLTVLETLLQSLGLGNLGANIGITGKGSISVSYDEAGTRTCPVGELINYLSEADFMHSNPPLLRQLNHDRLLVISGILEAKNVKVEIKSDTDFDVDVDVKFNNIIELGAEVEHKSNRHLVMRSGAATPIPVAVKAHRIIYDRGVFEDLRLVTDNRFFF